MIQYNEFELANGLKVLVHEDATTPMATVNLLYNVGSKNENREKTGFAHLFEHFMFEGSKNILAFDEEMQKAGGDNNAFTTNDFTNYYATLPASNIETAFWLESDRMLELNFSQESLDVQKSVVIEEFKETCINKPYGDMWHIISDMAYKVHPYQWPTIGYKLDHIAAIELQETKDFFYKYYRPNNAILSVSGGVKTTEIERLCQKWFAEIAPGEQIKTTHQKEPKQTETRHKTIIADVPVDSLFIAFRIENRESAFYYATDLLCDILGNGNTSRLYSALVKEKKLCSSISCYLSDTDEDGLFLIEAIANDGVPFEVIEQGIFDTIQLFTKEGLITNELEKVKNKTLNYLAFSNISHVNKSFNLAYFKKINHLYLINEESYLFKKVTENDVITAAKNYLKIENSSILYYEALKK